MTSNMFAWGSSSIEMMDASLKRLASSLGLEFYNGGDSGVNSDVTLAQMGARPAEVLFPNTPVTVGTPVEVQVLNIAKDPAIKPWSVKLGDNGLTGILSYSTGRWTFTRTDYESVRALNHEILLPVLPAVSGSIQLLNIGKNDMLRHISVETTLQRTQMAYDYAISQGSDPYVLGHFVTRDSSLAQQKKVMDLNQGLAATFGDRYIDLQTYFMGSDVWADSGVIPSARDLDMQRQGILPSSLALDSYHLTIAMNEALVAYIVRPFLIEKGVLSDPMHYWGSRAADVLVGSDEAEIYFGLAGNDILNGGGGGDQLNGGLGIDLASYRDAMGPIMVDMLAPWSNIGDAAGDSYNEIEGVIGSSFDDRLYADNAVNMISGLDGDDILSGRGGDDTLLGGDGGDTLIGGAGADVLSGGEGFDFASYQYASTGPVTVDLLAPAGNTGEAMGDQISGVEAIIGSSFDDRLYADNAVNMISGLDGDDILSGRGGDDTLLGGDGGDTLIGGAGADVLSGGEGFDFASYQYASTGPVTVDLLAPAGNTGEAMGDQISGVEAIIGSSFDDRLYADNAVNMISGLDGDDILSGRGGDDTLLGGDGGDTLIGGAGADMLSGGKARDWADYSTSDARVVVNLAKRKGFGGDAEGDRLVNIERIHGSAQNDTLIGDVGKNTLVGGGGEDRLIGGGDRDKLDGGAGRDNLVGGEGNDKLVGGAGRDKLNGGFGNDVMWGGGGDDTFLFDLGSDKLVGGEGRDTVMFDGAFEDYSVTFGKKVIVVLDDDRDVFIGMERLEFDDLTYVRESGSWVQLD